MILKVIGILLMLHSGNKLFGLNNQTTWLSDRIVAPVSYGQGWMGMFVLMDK